MVALAHVVAPRAFDIGDVAEIDRVLGRHRLARRRYLLERHAVLPPLGDIHEGAAVGAEHPLVGREDQEVGIERLHVDAAHARHRAWRRPAARRLSPSPPWRCAACRARRHPTNAPRRSTPAPAARAPGRSIASSTADVQSPSVGLLHRLDRVAAGSRRGSSIRAPARCDRPAAPAPGCRAGSPEPCRRSPRHSPRRGSGRRRRDRRRSGRRRPCGRARTAGTGNCFPASTAGPCARRRRGRPPAPRAAAGSRTRHSGNRRRAGCRTARVGKEACKSPPSG